MFKQFHFFSQNATAIKHFPLNKNLKQEQTQFETVYQNEMLYSTV